MARYTLKPPIVITPRLLPGVKIGDSFVSIEYSRRPGREGRTRYHYYIDGPGLDFDGDDLQSGAGGGSLQEGFGSLMSFLGAAADAYRAGMRGRESENADLFPSAVNEWAYQNDSEIQALQMDLEENPNLINEE